jgi:glycosyltransferase involved in cell wall biosynthesis
VHVTGDINYVVPFLIGRKSVLTVHDLAPLRAKTGWRRRVFRKLWYDWPLACTDAVTVVSNTIRSELSDETAYPVGQIEVIPNGVDPDFEMKPKAWPERPTVLMVGTKPQKNLERMFHALQGMNARVNVVGQLNKEQRSLAATLELEVNESGFLGQEALVLAYRNTDMLAFVSLYEGFGLPVVEAQATGRLVLTSNIASLREVSGEAAACLVDPLDVASIRDGFERILQNEDYRAALVRKGFENAKRYQFREVAASYASAYERL